MPLSALQLLLCCIWNIQLVLGAQTNITVDDTDALLLYEPPEAWHLNHAVCSSCPDVGGAYNGTYHLGTRAPASDATSHDGTDKDGKTGSGKSGDDTDSSKKPARQARWENARSFLPSKTLSLRGDPDVPVTVDPHVAIQFSFIGSAVYLYCIQSNGNPLLGTMPSPTNLTFTLDDQPSGTFASSEPHSTAAYIPHVNVFAKADLVEAQHVLRVNVEAGSVFLFDYLVYTKTETALANQMDPSTNASSSDIDEKRKKHNIATFAGAVGGSVGVLGVMSLCLAFSIIRRRRSFVRRERLAQDRSSLHTNGSDDSPMFGPAPFIPRFFPGTQLPPDPPPYVESESTSTLTSPPSLNPRPELSITPIMPSLTAPSPVSDHSHQPHLSDMSYADIPPATPPPVDDSHPPPPFGVHATVLLPIPPPGLTGGSTDTSQESPGETANRTTSIEATEAISVSLSPSGPHSLTTDQVTR